MIHNTFKFPRIDPKSSFYFSDGKGLHLSIKLIFQGRDLYICYDSGG